MDTYENDFTPAPRKRSPYADSPYECAYIEEETLEPMFPVPISKPTPKRLGWKIAGVCAMLIVACSVTALLTNALWQNRFDSMERALQDRFAALEAQLSKNQNSNIGTQLPAQGPLTPSEIYAKNVRAVVAVNAIVQQPGGYSESAGSGFMISADGYVVTNCHVIEGASKVSITTFGNETLDAEVIGKDETNDVALLKVEGEGFVFATMGSSDALAVGDMVVAIGNPLGELTSTLTVGYVSAKDRIVSTDGSVINMLQTDAAINSGNSGGPLFNTKGEVVGITTAKYSGDSGSGAAIEGLGFAIPMDDVTDILSDLKTLGYVTSAYLGISARDVDASGQSYGLPAGAYVVDVVAGGAADRAGIHKGDIIVGIGGYDTDSVSTLILMLRRFKAGETTSVIVYRNGHRVPIAVTLDEKPVQ